jgi:hypothetical protein
MVNLIADALLEHDGSAHRSFEQAREQDALPATMQAAYGKLGRLPIPLSMAFLAGCTARLQSLFPAAAGAAPPASLRGVACIIYEGKAIKRVAKRLKLLRGVAGGLLGGRALVAWAMDSGLVLALHAHPDGDANDVRFVPDLLPEVRQRQDGPRLHIADRQFCGLPQLAQFTAVPDDHFLIRYHRALPFTADAAHPARHGVDGAGRRYSEERGWLGGPKNKKRRYVRRITLERPGDAAIVRVTDVLDEAVYPATELLDVYLRRWGIERVFQQVTEVFGLQRLIGGTPHANIFQFAFCLVLYNLLQLLRAYVAAAQQQPTDTISLEKMFADVTDELIVWNRVITPATTVALFGAVPPLDQIQRRLRTLLASAWTERWRKAPSTKRQVPTKQRKRTHGSVYRILEAHRRQTNTMKRLP